MKSTFGKRHKSYFLVENPRNLNALNKYRSERTLLSVCESDSYVKNKSDSVGEIALCRYVRKR